MTTRKATKATTTTTKKSTERPVLVTTEHRGVFFGYLRGPYDGGSLVSLTRARLAVYWSSAMGGFMGLASTGPDSQCRIGPRADITLRGVTAVTDVTPEATAKWESAAWMA